MEACCSTHLGWMGTYQGCSLLPDRVAPNPTATSTRTPTEKPTTEMPTQQPTATPSHPPTSAPTAAPSSDPSVTPTRPPTADPTPSPTKKPTKKPTDRPTKMPVEPRKIPGAEWYIDWDRKQCVADGNKSGWVQGHSTAAVCCRAHMNYDYSNCLGGNGPAPRQPTKWYVDWTINGGKCRQGTAPGTWVALHSSADACCRTHMSWKPRSQCEYSG